nr:hypothetical protein CFP56_20574 [Quercus suber]
MSAKRNNEPRDDTRPAILSGMHSQRTGLATDSSRVREYDPCSCTSKETIERPGMPHNTRVISSFAGKKM